MSYWLIYISIFLVPLASLLQMKGTIVWYPQMLVVLALGMTLASYYIWKLNKPLALIAAYSSFSYLFVCQQHPRAMILLFVCYAGIALVCAASKIRNTKPLYIALITMSMIQFGLLILQNFSLDPLFHSNDTFRVDETVGFLGSHNQLGIYSAAVAPIIFHFCFPLMFVAVIAVLLSSSSAAALGALAALATYLYFMRLRWMLVPMIILSIISCIFFTKDNIGQIFKNRAKLWQQTLMQAEKGKVTMDKGNGVKQVATFNPYLGAGIGNFMTLSPQSQGESLFGKGWSYKDTPRWEHAHNDLIEYKFDFGWLGMLPLVWLLFDIVSKFVKSIKTNMLVVTFSSLVALAVTSMGVYVMHAPVSYFITCLMLGLFYAEVENAKTRHGMAVDRSNVLVPDFHGLPDEKAYNGAVRQAVLR